jgi:hypothetical protein
LSGNRSRKSAALHPTPIENLLTQIKTHELIWPIF